AIWKATVTSPGGWTNSFTFLRLSPALIWEAAERPEPFAGTLVVDEPKALPDQGSTPAAPQQPDADSAAGPTDAVGDLLAMLEVEEAGPELASAVGTPVD